jgi:ATP-binding cassette subfamily B protein
MYFGNTIVTFAFAVTLMTRIDARLTLLSLIPLPILSLAVARMGGKLHHYYEAIQASFAALTAKAQETLAGIRVVKAHVEEEGEYRAFLAIHEDYLEKNRAMIKIWSGMWPMLSLLGGIAAAIVLWVGGSAVVSGKITLGELVAFQIYLAMLIWPMISLGWVSNLFQRGAASMGRIRAVLELPAEDDVEPGLRATGPRDAATPAIELENICFRYPGTERDVLHGLTLTIRAGETVAVVGRTGSGKTTLLNLIARLYEPTAGLIRFEGRPTSVWPRGPQRRRLGIVPQETFLFSDTIRANVAFGFQENEAGPDVDAVVRRAGLAADLGQFPQGLDTLIGERGITLSGGQKQRTAISRAVITDPKILILDDALSAVDTYTEEEILSRLAGVMRSRRTIIVSHRVSTVRNADQILVLDDGEIVERGTHDQLVARNGVYAELYRKQLLEEELAAS